MPGVILRHPATRDHYRACYPMGTWVEVHGAEATCLGLVLATWYDPTEGPFTATTTIYHRIVLCEPPHRNTTLQRVPEDALTLISQERWEARRR
jgi:hypothetical protein